MLEDRDDDDLSEWISKSMQSGDLASPRVFLSVASAVLDAEAALAGSDDSRIPVLEELVDRLAEAPHSLREYIRLMGACYYGRLGEYSEAARLAESCDRKYLTEGLVRKSKLVAAAARSAMMEYEMALANLIGCESAGEWDEQEYIKVLYLRYILYTELGRVAEQTAARRELMRLDGYNLGEGSDEDLSRHLECRYGKFDRRLINDLFIDVLQGVSQRFRFLGEEDGYVGDEDRRRKGVLKVEKERTKVCGDKETRSAIAVLEKKSVELVDYTEDLSGIFRRAQLEKHASQFGKTWATLTPSSVNSWIEKHVGTQLGDERTESVADAIKSLKDEWGLVVMYYPSPEVRLNANSRERSEAARAIKASKEGTKCTVTSRKMNPSAVSSKICFLVRRSAGKRENIGLLETLPLISIEK
jgi:hypothetical protein